jgi:hypothetical protein
MADDFFSNQTIIERAIIKKIDGTEIDLLDQNQGNTPFFRLIMKESMFEPMLSGTLFVQDKKSSGEKLNFVGGEIFEITIKTPLSGADQNLQFSDDSLGLVSQNNLIQNLRFYIFRVKSLTDEATVQIDAEKGPATMWNLDFGPYELIYFNKTDAPLYDGEFIGKIAGDDGFVDYLAERYFNPTELSTCQEPMDIEPTLNSIWFKGNHASYPYGKDNPYLELGRLMNYISEYSVSGENTSAVNYLFWQDLKKWHFRSVESLISEQQDSSRTYKVSIDRSGKDKIQNFRMIKQIDQSELINSDAYKSFYVNVEPNYDDIYSDYMPTNDRLLKTRVDYDYRKDYESWSHIEGNPVLPTSLDYENGNSNELHDDVFGWFNLGEHNNQTPTKFDYLNVDNNKNDMKAWQTNFDMTEMDADLLKKMRVDVIDPAEENYNLYTRKRLLKEKWNVYKYAICCDNQPQEKAGSRLLGFVTGFERFKLPTDDDPTQFRNIWKYYWVPVEIWLEEEIANLQELDESDEFEVVAKEGPFAVVKIPQEEGVTLEAWNLNELNNGTFPQESLFLEQLVEAGVDLENAQIDPSLLYKYLGPGYNEINLKASASELSKVISANVSAEHYMPVGGIVISGSKVLDFTPLNFADQEIGGLTDPTNYRSCYVKNVGQLIELFAVPDNLSILEQRDDVPLSDELYLFNVENAVDGDSLPCIMGDLEVI